MDVIVITGASGFVGRSLVGALASAGFRGFAVSRGGNQDVPEGWKAVPRAQFLADWSPPEGSTVTVVHLEVLHHVAEPRREDLERFKAVNVGNAAEWLDWCADLDIKRFVYLSSIKAVNNQVTDLPVTESATGPGSTPYGASKWQAERIVRDWSKQAIGRSCLILRPAVVYGPGNQANMASMADAIRRRRFLFVGGSKNIKSVVSIRNLCAAVRFLIEKMEVGLDVFNLVDERSYSVSELAAFMQKAMFPGVKDGGSDVSRIWSVPYFVIRIVAIVGDILLKMGLQGFPVTTTRVEALTETSWFSSEKLKNAGFQYFENTESGLAFMVGGRK